MILIAWIAKIIIFTWDKRGAILTSTSHLLTGFGIIAVNASYSDKQLHDYQVIHKNEGDLVKQNIYSEIGNLKTTGEDLKYGVRVINENLIKAASGNGQRLKRIEYEYEK